MMIILVGPSGSGKSTYAREIFPDYIICSADDFMYTDGVYTFDPAKLGWAHRACRTLAEAHLVSTRKVVIDNTNTRAKERQPYLKMAQDLGSEVEIHCLPWSPEFLTRNIHGVLPELVQKQLSRIDLEFGWVYNEKGEKLRPIERA